MKWYKVRSQVDDRETWLACESHIERWPDNWHRYLTHEALKLYPQSPCKASNCSQYTPLPRPSLTPEVQALVDAARGMLEMRYRHVPVGGNTLADYMAVLESLRTNGRALHDALGPFTPEETE